MSEHELEHALREGGEKVTEGRIRIDATRALQRLRDFRFADPSHWVLEVLRAAVESDATSVEVETDADDVILRFDGAAFAEDALAHLLEKALEPGNTREEQRTRLLALGAAGALGAGAVFVKVESGAKALTLTQATVEVTARRATRTTSFHLRKGFGWRVVAGFFRGSPEGKAIAARAHRFPLPLRLDGKDVVEPTKPERHVVEGKGWTLDVFLPPHAPLTTSTLELDVLGVLVATRSLALPGLQLEAHLRADGLRRNASGSDVVDDDALLDEALKALRKVSRTLLSERLEALCTVERWRKEFIAWLLHPSLEAEVKKVLQGARVLPGPAGEWVSLEAVATAQRSHGWLPFAFEPLPGGTYPDGTVLLANHRDLVTLLPEGKRFNVKELVQQRARVVENRARVAAAPLEVPTLPDRDWAARAPVTGRSLVGEVGFDASLHGAFVRVLHEGRLLESGELDALAPLRLRAVVDITRPLGDMFFDDRGASKALGLVAEAVETAATDALCAALPAPAALAHAHDLLERLVVQRGTRLPGLREALREAPLFPCLGRAPVSLQTLHDEAHWSYVRTPFAFGLLDESRVLVLNDAQLQILKKLGLKRLDDVTARLTAELDIRKRLDGPREYAELPDVVVKVPVAGEGLEGEVGIPRAANTALSLTLLKRGLRLETTSLTARYQHAIASVDAADLTPNQKWTAVTRDAAFQRALTAVSDAQRRLVLELVKLPRASWRTGGELFFRAFLEKELRGFTPDTLDDVTRVVAEAKVFDAGARKVSLLELKAHPRVLISSPTEARPPVPGELLVLFESLTLLPTLVQVLGRALGDAGPELQRLAARRQLEARPVVKFELPAGLSLRCELSQPGFTALAGLREGIAPEATVHVHVASRLYATVQPPCALPLLVFLELPGLEPRVDGELSADQLAEMRQALDRVVRAVVGEALPRLPDPNAARAVLLALGRGVDGSLPSAEAEALRRATVFPCTDGVTRDLHGVSTEALHYVSRKMVGTLPDGLPILIADTEPLHVALRRWPRAKHVGESLKVQAAALRQREQAVAVEQVHLRLDSPWRQRLDAGGLTGEVVLAREGAGRLELFLGKKPLTVLADGLAGPLAAAVDSPRLTPTLGFTGVERDAAFVEVQVAVKAARDRLAAELDPRQAPPGWEPTLVQFAFELTSERAWKWKGKKKPSKKSKRVPREEPVPNPALLRFKLLRTNDGEPSLCLEDLIERQTEEGKVTLVSRGGAFLEAGRKAWWPRAGELEWATKAGFAFDDVTEALRVADSIRARPRFDVVAAPIQSAWREPVHRVALEGEVALGDVPDGLLVIEVLHERMLLERWSGPHPVGGTARVSSTLLTPDDAFTQAKRDQHFKALISATEAALEKLLLRRLQSRDATFPDWARAAVRWRAGQAGPLAAALPALPLFESLAGTPVTVGEVLQLAARQGRVSLATPGDGTPPEPTVLLDSPVTRATLAMLELRFDDVTQDLRRAENLKHALTSRRLASLKWKGEALVRVQVDAGPLQGELALSTEAGVVMLARDGICLHALEERWPGVVGVVGIDGLAVDADWTKATPTRAQLGLVRAQVERLFGALAEAAKDLGPREREQAASWALEFLAHSRVESLADLQRSSGAAQALADAPLFVTVEDEKVTLRALAAEVSSGARLAVFERGAGPSSPVTACVLSASSFSAPWLTGLEALLGKGRVWRVTAPAEWQQAVREADPPEGTALLAGLKALRKELRLLRAGALGPLTPDELEDVRLAREGGATPLRYEAKRKLVFLDPEHPDIARALTELSSRPERLWVLLVAVFGLVNRELDHITDAHEAQLLMALAGHLASNPKLLD